VSRPTPAGPVSAAPVDPGLVASLRGLTRDGRLLFLTRFLRMFSYGALAVVLVLYLASLGLDPITIGLILTLSLIGDTLISLWLTTNADRFGRRRVLIVGTILMAFAGVAFALTSVVALLILAATIGVISPSGNEVGPFLAVEQAGLSETTPDARRTATFAWYNLAGYVATALGALAAGLVTQVLIDAGWTDVDAYRAIVVAYAALGLVMAAGFALVSPAVEPARRASDDDTGIRRRLGLGRSKAIVARLSGLFAIDAFAGGFVPQALMAYWFSLQFGVPPAALGLLFFSANVLAAVSSLSAARLAARFGLINTMVFTHLPSNVLLILVPFMPTLPLAVACLLARYVLSQMDVPTRQSYVMAVVDPDERSAAAGVTGVARTTGAAVSPILSTPLIASASFAGAPFVIAGSLKIVYDLLLYAAFKARPAPGEAGSRA
jgi:MFS family permease